MNWLLISPILVPLVFVMLLFFAWHRPNLQRALSVIATSAQLFIAIKLLLAVNQHGYLTMQLSSWKAPYGITLVADNLSALMVLSTAFIMFCVSIYSLGDIGNRSVKKGFYPAYCILMAGLSGAFLTGDIFNLYVWFEIILISSFVLMILGDRRRQLEGAVKYAVLNLIATLILLTAIAMLYGITGSLNMADIANILQHSPQHGLITTIAVIFIIAFGIKSALFPLFFWLPASYHTTFNSSSAIFAGLLSKVGVYSFLRIFTLLFISNASYLHELLLIMANLTLIIAIIAAIAKVDLRRILSFTLISHIGYMIVGLAIFTPLALLGSIFYMIQHMLVKANLFLASGYLQQTKRETSIVKVGKLFKEKPLFAIIFFIAAFSLAGIPPLSGFWGKLFLIEASFKTGHYFTLAIILVAALLTIFVITRIWQNLFLSEQQHSDIIDISLTKWQHGLLVFPMILLSVAILFVGLYPACLYHFASQASQQLLHPSAYIHAVLGGNS